MRYPARIGSWRYEPRDGRTPEGLLEVLRNVVDDLVRDALTHGTAPALLLSGGMDSTMLLMLIHEALGDWPECCTIATSGEHPDAEAAYRLEKELGIGGVIYYPDEQRICEAQAAVSARGIPENKGDEAVLIAVQLAAKHSSVVFATDGIDELMGGYWWHVHAIEHDEPPPHPKVFRTIEEVFETFWDKLEPLHLTPMAASADECGVMVCWPFLNNAVVEYIAGIPLTSRVAGWVNKAFWKQTARLVGVPEWVIERPKLGFVDALSP